MKKALLYMIRPMEPNEIYARQEMNMAHFCKQRNMEIIEKFSDIGYPSSNIKRPALQQLIHFLRNDPKRVDTVLFYGMEHFEKDMARIYYLEPIIKRYVTEILYIQDSLYDEIKIIDEIG